MPVSALAVLYPAIAEVSRRVGADAVGLIDVDGVGGSNLDVDRALVTYSTGLSLGHPSSPLQVSATVVGDQPVPARAIPEVVARIEIVVEQLRAAIGKVPEHGLPVVITTWALSRWTLEGRLGFLHRLVDAGAERPVAWVSVEGVGVAPAVPTLGDRRASGHSIIGLAVFDHRTLHVEAVGRCWSKGRWLMWLGGGDAG